ncbi:hypothetical protein FNF28_07609 [Cafeteria roenbergensis]|uniref:Sulfatase N-terminal domain-containing protein n=1 Tax=Cafeteria roenbergensis TaxID=33653 RepID=A0A5A8C3G7_CAFRO|nr:hypothetical protein FNF28_07609 [Cafeteria roenbergensis]
MRAGAWRAAAVWCLLLAVAVAARGPRHVVVILADDLGHADLEWMSTPLGQIKTPNLRKLRERGIQLDNYHVQQVCSPSRAALHTGRYPIRYGMQHYVIPHNGTWGVPTDEVFLPAVLKRARGFKTAHTGKHHMGMAKWSYTPTFRGYDSFVGYYGGECTYFGCFYDTTYDMHRDMRPECGPGCSEVAWDLDSTYSTYIFTDRAVEVIKETDAQADRLFLYVAYQAVHSPNQVPQQYVDPYNATIADQKRRTFAGMLSCMDEGIGNITEALRAKGMLDDTLIVFSTDNGGPVDVPDCDVCADATGSVNWPLRGGKFSLWQGGVLGTAFIAGSGVPESRFGTSYGGLMHIADWLPTLAYGALGIGPEEVPTKPLDGVNQWDAIVGNAAPPRESYLVNIDRLHEDGGHAGFQQGDWKLMVGRGGPPDSWMAPLTSGPAVSGTRLAAELEATRAAQRGVPLALARGACIVSADKALRRPGGCDSGVMSPGGFAASPDLGHCYLENDTLAGAVVNSTFASCFAACQRTPGCAAFSLVPHPPTGLSSWYNTTVQLFNIADDPYERHDLAAERPDVVARLLPELHAINATVVPPAHHDPNCPPFDPSKTNNSYLPWCGMG